MAKRSSVGGQAVIEGVMMRGSRGIATAVRTYSGEIEVDVQETIPYTKRHKILGLPVIRGFVSLLESLVVGINTLNYSASFFEEEGEPGKLEAWLDKKLNGKSMDVIMGFSLMISLCFAIGLFFVLPTLSANLFKRMSMNTLGLNIVEGIIRVFIFLIYIYLIGKMEDIRRVFEYHGAEHKTIFCYENEMELTPENASRFQRFHPRCGTNFLFLVMIVSIVIFSLTGWNSIWQRILYRVILLPVISGVTYELIKWLGKSDSTLARFIAYPGLKLQELTTREPDFSELEVAIVALKAAEGIPYEHLLNKASADGAEQSAAAVDSIIESENLSGKSFSIGELLLKGSEKLKSADIESYMLDSQLLLAKAIEKDKLYVITNRDAVVTGRQAEQYLEYIDMRKTKKPVKYILQQCEFMGLDLFIKEGVLVPRPDTEILVEEVIKEIKARKYVTLCDVCSGSGAIGLALANEVKELSVDFYDISETAGEVNSVNIEKLGLSERAAFYKSDLLKEASSNRKSYDVIVSNPPYIRADVIPTLMEDVKNHEPYIALCGGEDGLDFYRRITAESQECLKAGGLLAYEIGFDQGEAVQDILRSNGFDAVRCVKDLAGHDRVVLGTKL